MNSYRQIRKIVFASGLIALSAIGALVKIPSPVGSIALDSFPGYLAVLLLGYIYGAIVIAIGHLLSALTAGMPLGLHVHLFIACGMMICAASLRLGYKVHRVLGIALATVMNGVVLLYVVAMLFGYGMGFFYTLLPYLVTASLINIVIAVAIYESMKNRVRM